MGKPKTKPKHSLGIIKPMGIPLTKKRDVQSSVFIALGEEWEQLVSTLANDSLGLNEQYILQVPSEILDKFPNLRAVYRPIKNFISRHYKRKYRIRQLDSKEYGPVVVVEHPGPGA